MLEWPLGSDRPPSTGATTVTGTEEGRAFFQHRLALVGLCMFLLAAGTWVILEIVYLLLPPDGRVGAYNPLAEGGPFHLGAGLLSGALWLLTRRGRQSGPLLHGLDIAVTLIMLTVFTFGAASAADPVVGGFVGVLCFNTGMLARAIVVPSTARRTLLLGLLAGAPVVALAAWRGAANHNRVGGAVAAACWASVGVALGTVASHTIFGLRREVQQARVLGQYTLESKIGEGGMGEVWRASHALLRRPTAIKLLPPSRAGDAAIRRFEREVQITARLSHPSTVAIYDYGRTRDGLFYYAMELLEGSDLERLVAEHGPQPAGRVVHVLAQVCGALAEAHDLGLVHRDVKPANVLLLPRHGEPELAKVVDFGLVKDLQNADGARAGLTAANTITGTPLYMAPEAIQQPEAIGAASDLYSLGAVGWFLLVGRPPFEGNTIVEVCSKHLYTPAVRPSDALGHAVAPDLEDLVLTCLEKTPQRRPAGARELRSALKACSVANHWTEELAARWWRDHERRARTAPPAGGPRTLALDVATRGA
jgi:hypothetical protein